MADYSGYFRCQHCGASGDNMHPAQHKDSCPVSEQLARIMRESQLRKDAEEAEKISLYDEFDSMTDDEVVASAHALQSVLDFYTEQAQPVEKRVNAAREVIRRRPGLLNKYLNR